MRVMTLLSGRGTFPLRSHAYTLMTDDTNSGELATQRGQQIIDILKDAQVAIPTLISSSPLTAAKGESFNSLHFATSN